MGRFIKHELTAGSTTAAALIAEGFAAASRENFAQGRDGTGGSTDDEVFGCYDGGEVQGVALFRRRPAYSRIEVRLFYVEPTCRRQGVATMLHKALCDEAAKRGYDVVRYVVDPNNDTADIVLSKLRGEPMEVAYDVTVRR